MLSILRVSGPSMNLEEVATLISAIPYRIGRKGEKNAKTNSLYYDVVENHKGTFLEMLDQVMEWLKKSKDIQKLKVRSDVTHIELDVGVFINEEMFSSSYLIPSNFLQFLGDLGLSVVISIYKTENVA
jgi:hypothetical protein